MGAVELEPPRVETKADDVPVVSGVPPDDASPEPDEPDERTPRRWWLWIGLAVGTVAVAVAGLLMWSPWRDSTPRSPDSVRVASTEATAVELRWDVPDGGPTIESYVVVQDDADVGSTDAPATSFLVTELTGNTDYEFTVVSVVGERRSEPSAVVAVTTDPGAPTSPGIEDRTATSVQLSWTAPRGPIVDAYVVVNDGDELGVVDHPDTSFVVTELIPGASYDFEVIAEAGPRRSVPASIVAVTDAPTPGAMASDPAANTVDTIVVTWTPPSEVAAPAEYLVIRDGETVATVPGDTLSYTDTGLAPATGHEYQVAAAWGFEPSEPTEVLGVATAEPPVADARLAGTWSVDIAVVEDPGENQAVGTTWTSTWSFEPACEAGVCDVSLVGGYGGPGFEFKGFTVQLVRDGASYAGSTPAQVTYCSDVAVDNTVTVRLDVDAAGVEGRQWVAESWTGTLEISSPYMEVGEYYCPSQTITASLSAR